MVTVAVVVILLTSPTVVVAQDSEPEPLLPIPQVIVGMGDSLTSGNGANDYDDRVPECYRSPNSWAAQFATKMNKDSTFLNRACSKGVFAEVTNVDRLLGRVRKDLRGNCPIPSSGADDYYVSTARGIPRKCDHFVMPQILSLDSTVDLVLFGMGANDLQFLALLQRCFIFAFRDARKCQDQLDYIREYVDTWTQDLADVLMAMAPLLKPTARVVVLQFPYLALDVPQSLK